jgi:ribosomal protein L11 methylase PrmA
MITQLRIYTINRDSMDEWVKEWQDKIKPLRLKLGFAIPDAWTDMKNNRFYWIMQYDGKEDWNRLDAAFHESEERRSMQPNPARHIARMEEYFIDKVA